MKCNIVVLTKAKRSRSSSSKELRVFIHLDDNHDGILHSNACFFDCSTLWYSSRRVALSAGRQISSFSAYVRTFGWQFKRVYRWIFLFIQFEHKKERNQWNWSKCQKRMSTQRCTIDRFGWRGSSPYRKHKYAKVLLLIFWFVVRLYSFTRVWSIDHFECFIIGIITC